MPDTAALPRPAPTTHAGLLAWVEEVRTLVRPASVRWCDGSQAEYDACLAAMAASGAAIALDPARRPASYLFRSHPSDVARIEDRTFIAARDRAAAGPTNNWIDPVELKRTMSGLYAGCMAGRTMYVVPFAMGPIGSPLCRIGVQITDSPYVVVSMRIMTRMGAPALRALGDAGSFVPCLHAVGRPLRPGEVDEHWPCAPIERKYIAHFPEERLIWSFGSGYGGNALLGKKCLALRIASVMARDEGWLAEHMLILALTSPWGRTHYIAAAFPSACGKTNLAMMQPTLPGWTVRVLGDDIAWMRIGADGRLRAVNPEAGFFGVAPGTSARSNPHAMAMLARDTLFTNCALGGDGDVWWEGKCEPPSQAVDWQGQPWSPASGRPGAHPNARFTVPAANCPVLDPRWDDPEGVPISAILFGGRRPATIPLVNEALSWEHGVFMGSSTGSETTAANLGQAGVLRRDPFAMLPFCGYHMGDYLAHWLAMGRRLGAGAPRIFFVNWFRRDGMGRFLWPGFGDNVRVLKYIAERIDGADIAQRTPIGLLPRADALDVSGLDLPSGRLQELLAVDRPGWKHEVGSVRGFYSTLGDRLPPALDAELTALDGRLAGS